MARFRKHIGLILLAVYAFFFASTNLFYHSHQIEGITLVHSHPFSGASHSHTANQILLIEIIDSATYQGADNASAPDLIPVLLGDNICKSYTAPVLTPDIFSFSLRAPPAAGC